MIDREPIRILFIKNDFSEVRRVSDLLANQNLDSADLNFYELVHIPDLDSIDIHAAQTDFDLIMVDNHRTEAGPNNLLHQIRERIQDAPILVIGASDARKTVGQLSDQSLQEYLFVDHQDHDQFIKTIHQIVDRYRGSKSPSRIAQDRPSSNVILVDGERSRVGHTQPELDALLGHILLDFHNITDLVELLNLICRSFIEMFKAEAANLWLVRQDVLECFVAQGVGADHFSGSQLDLQDEKAIITQVIHERRVIQENCDGESTRGHPGWVDQPLIKTILGVPLFRENSAVGALLVGLREPVMSNEARVRYIAMRLGEHAAIAIENAQLFEIERQRRREAETLRQSAVELTAAHSLEEVLNQILVHLERVVPYDSASICLVVGKHLRVYACQNGQDSEAWMGQEYPIESDGLFQKIQDTQGFLILADVRLEPQFMGWGSPESTQSWMGVPLIVRGQVIGLLNLGRRTVATFTATEANLAQAIADQAAIAIDRTHLFDETRRQARELFGLYETALATSSILVTGALLARLKTQIMQLLDPDAFGVFLYDQETDEFEIGLAVEGGKELADWVGRRILVEQGGLTGWVIQNRSPLLLGDVLEEPPPVEPIHLSTAARSWLGVPLITRSRLIGAMTIQSKQPNTFSSRDQRFLESLAAQVSIALENARLYEQERRDVARREALNAIISATATWLDLPTILATAIDQTMLAVGVNFGGIWLGDYQIIHGLPSEQAQQLIDEVRTQQAHPLKSLSERVVVDDWHGVEPDDPHGHLRAFILGLGFRATLGVPILAPGEPVGRIILATQQRRVWSPEEIDLVEAVGRQIAVALKNTRLFEAERQRSAELEALRKASLQLTSSLELQPVLEAILRQTLKLVSASDAHIFLYDNGRLGFGAALFAGSYQKVPFSEPRENGLTYQVARTGEPLIIPDVNQHPLFADYQWGGGIVGLPLRKGTQVLGVMSVAMQKPHLFDDAELRVMGLLADQAAIAIENARLFSALQARLQELSAIADASTALRGAANVQQIGKIVAEQARNLVQAHLALLFLTSEDQSSLTPLGWVGFPDGKVTPALNADRGIAGQVLKSGEIYRSENLLGDFAFDENSDSTEASPGVVVPLRTTTDEFVGLMMVARTYSLDDGIQGFSREDERLLITLSEITGNALQRARKYEQLEAAYLETVLSLAKAMDARDTYTSNHSQWMAGWAEEVTRQIGFNHGQIKTIRMAALLHDIGKIGVPDHILLKPGPLTEEEWQIIQRHPEIGAEIVTPVKQLSDVVPLIRGHQEKYDGSGYPDRLRGDEIPLGARILAVVEAYSAMTADRVYRKALTHQEAVSELKRGAGSQFDPQIVEVFLQILEEHQLRGV